MSPSYREIDYSVRPAKAIERKMILQLCRKLENFSELSQYRYVGFGSTEFRDFRLIHRELGIEDLVSFERDFSHEERFRYNKPFDCIDLRIQSSYEALPSLDWSAPVILWLDYDKGLSEEKLGDISTFLGEAPSGSLLLVTINVEPMVHSDDILGESGGEDALDEFAQRIGNSRVPDEWSPGDFVGDGTAAKCWDIFDNHVTEKLRTINSAIRADGGRRKFEQLVHFRYADDARMMTVGGVLFTEADSGSFHSARFHRLDFVRRGGEPNEIRVPVLTRKERTQLNAQLPSTDPAELEVPGVEDADIEDYAQIYRHFPEYVEARR